MAGGSAAGAEHCAYVANKSASAGRCGNAAAEDGFVREFLAAVVSRGVVTILVDDVAGEIDAGEDAFASRVGEESGV